MYDPKAGRPGIHSRVNGTHKPFSPHQASKALKRIFPCDADSLELHGVSNWDQWFHYLATQLRFEVQFECMPGIFIDYATPYSKDYDTEQKQ